MKLQNAERAGYIEDVMELYEAAFPEDEKKPFDYMMSLVREGKMEILAIEEDGTFAGLCITVAGGNDTFILDYFAVSKERRSAGIGGRALKLLLDIYIQHKLHILLLALLVFLQNLILSYFHLICHLESLLIL